MVGLEPTTITRSQTAYTTVVTLLQHTHHSVAYSLVARDHLTASEDMERDP